jgi:4-amino-4-deoxychorismate lyase
MNQSQQMKIECPLLDVEWIKELINLNSATKGIWRLKMLITGGDQPTLRLPLRQSITQLFTLRPYSLSPFTPCRLSLFPDCIHKPTAKLKTLAYLDRLFIYDYAQLKGYDDAVVCNHEGYLLETAFANIFWIDDQSIFFPDPGLGYLDGILLNQILKNIDLPIQFFKGGIEDIPHGSSVYTSNSLTHVRPVIEIDHRYFPRHVNRENQLKRAIQRALLYQIL